jgi:hypothetical protein
MKEKKTSNTEDMKKQTPNAERRTSKAELPIIRLNRDSRVKEDAPAYRAARKTDSTLNIQRPTFNGQRKRQGRFDLEERLLKFSTRIIRLVDALSNTRAANHVAGQLLRCGTSPYGDDGEVEAAGRWALSVGRCLLPCRTFDVRCSAFAVRCLPPAFSLGVGRWALSVERFLLFLPAFDVRCSMFGVRCFPRLS